MKLFKNIPIVGFLTSFILLGTTSSMLAGEGVILQPGDGRSFVIGSKRATAYFYPKAGECEVTLMLGQANAMAGKEYLSASRLKIRLTPMNITRIDSFKGQSLSIICNASAKTITIMNKRVQLTNYIQ
jgi:hypothetical protein